MASDVPSPPTRLFVMKKLLGGQDDTEFIKVEPVNRGPGLHCPQCGNGIGMLTWEPPYRAELELYGKAYGDLVDGPGSGLLVTERFANDFRAEGLTGLSGFHPVEVVRVRRKRPGPKAGLPPRYLYVTVGHGQPAADMERSRIKGSRPMGCTWCRYVGTDAIDGIVLEAGTWHGEDVFEPRGLWGTTVVSERFMRFAERHAMSHMSFVPIEKYVYDPSGHFYPRSVQSDPPSRS
ncbi:MAG TPA: hypothetical protein VK447_07260 [Myxococcaceae bacterium]|nr:hypothetical protein [Myxococcaceae bacterium]